MFCENASLAAWQWQLCLPVLQLWNTKSVLINLKIALDSITNQPPLPFSCNRTRKLHKPASWKPRIPVDELRFIRNECQFYKRRQPPPPGLFKNSLDVFSSEVNCVLLMLLPGHLFILLQCKTECLSSQPSHLLSHSQMISTLSDGAQGQQWCEEHRRMNPL